MDIQEHVKVKMTKKNCELDVLLLYYHFQLSNKKHLRVVLNFMIVYQKFDGFLFFYNIYWRPPLKFSERVWIFKIP